MNGHSLGGTVALQLQKDMPDRNFTVSTYGAPTVSFTQSENRFRNPGDPISLLDFGTKTTEDEQPSLNQLKAHSYQHFNHTSETSNNGWVTDKQFTPQPQYNAPAQPIAIQPQNDTVDNKWVDNVRAN